MSEAIANAAAAAPAESAPAENNETTTETSDVLADAAAPAADLTKAEKKEIQKRIEKFKLKIDGEEEDFELDLEDREAIKKHLQLSKVSQKRMQESSEIRKAAEEFITALQKDPRKIMKELGVNEKELAQMIMNEELADLEKTPEQREIEKLQRQLAEIEEKKKTDEENRKKSDFERMKQEAEQKIETDISAALQMGGVAKTPYTVRKMAELMYVALENDIDLKPQDVVPLVRKQMEADIRELFSATSDDQLEEFLKDQMPRIRKRNVAKAKAAPAATVKETSAAQPKKEEIKKISISDFLKGKK